mmetsp:Transcript_101384/g.286000  ORF Transcript_101384/g.286000 Transcript_101384/m.286000 type:complete len:200 (+) Transcript_101384:116-715(+)|eukprot:CAMPEP_0117554286 /NCGR_PEP_ID=MMETSP0784-20121206/50675_1 /TAXON_ID=39447 /ORGANISM="" /LENGTH=199 /DNA_ID=CAMNT_0005351445 /DNA_START=111 /DNA_END=707 /DNA_ORIENTATION=+
MATPGQLQMYNKLEVMEMFSLDQRAMDHKTGKIKRIHIVPDEKVPDACLFKIWLEDHTLGHTLRMELLRNEDVLFAGYKVPHPLDHMIELRVQTLPKSSPEIVLRHAVENIRTECRSMLDQFDQGVAAWQKLHGKQYERDDADEFTSPVGLSDGQNAMSASVGSESEERRFQNRIEELERIGPQTSDYSPSYSQSRSPG